MMSVGDNIPEYFPVGMKFLPTEVELLGHFLYNKVAGALEQVDALSVKDLDIYGEEPWRIWDENGGRLVEAQGCNDLYFFTQLKAKHSKGLGLMMNRTVCGSGGGRGTWDGEDGGTEVYKWNKSSKKRVLLGSKRRFKYVSKSGGCCGGAEWIMIEYSLNPELLPTSSSSSPNNLVLCLLRKKPLPNGRKLVQCLESYNHDDKERSTKRILLMDDDDHHHHEQEIHQQIQQHQSNLQPTSNYYDHNNIPAAGALIPSQIEGGGGLAANGSFADSTPDPDFSLDEFLFQDFGSVAEEFPDLFKDN